MCQSSVTQVVCRVLVVFAFCVCACACRTSVIVKSFGGKSSGFGSNYFLKLHPCSAVTRLPVIIIELHASTLHSWHKQKTELCDFSIMVKPHFVRICAIYSSKVWEEENRNSRHGIFELKAIIN